MTDLVPPGATRAPDGSSPNDVPGDVHVRPARVEDVGRIYDNIAYWASKGRMLVRPMQNVYENLKDFFVAERIDGD
ncbi:MAG: hypothetical protein WD336_07440, partial [Trueperaceae bacterium]